MNAWESAYKDKRRAFYEPSTGTVRACPENYCLAVYDGEKWEPHPWDGAIREITPAIRGAIYQVTIHGKDGETLAALLSLKLNRWRFRGAK